MENIITLFYVIMERKMHRLPESYGTPGAKVVRDLPQPNENLACTIDHSI